MRKSYLLIFLGYLLLHGFYGKADRNWRVPEIIFYAEQPDEAAPEAPVAVKAANIGSTGFLAVWKASDSTDSYQLDVSRDNFTTMLEGYNGLMVNDTSHTVGALVPGTTYWFRVRAVNQTGTSGNSNSIEVITPLEPPVAISAAEVTPTGFLARWEAATNAASYQLDVSADNFTTILEDYNSVVVSGTSHTINGLAPGASYQYRVRAVNQTGTSLNSNSIAVTTAFPALQAPAALTAVNVTPASFLAIWKASDSAESYQLDVSKDNFTTLLEGYNSLMVNDTSHTVSGLAPGAFHQYRVRAVNQTGTSGNSNIIDVITPLEPPVAMSAAEVTPTGFLARWEAAPSAERYQLDVSTDNFTTILEDYNSLVVNGTSHRLSGLAPGAFHQYRVRAVNQAGTSANSNIVEVKTLPSPPPPPTALEATNINQAGFMANWKAVSNALTYILEVSTDNFNTLVDMSSEIVDTGATISALLAGTVYQYRVKAVNEGGVSNPSNAVSVITLPAAPSLLDPSGITVSSFIANWNPVRSAISYVIDVSIGGLTAFIAEKITGTSIKVTGLQPATEYTYRVKAVNESGESGYSDAKLLTTSAAAPSVPQNVVIDQVTQTSFQAGWDAVTGADSYLIDVATTSTFDAGSFVAGFQDKAVTATNTPVAGLAPGVTYYFRVKAVNEGGASPYATASVQTLQAAPEAPANHTASEITQTSFKFSWDAVTGADSYLIDVATTSTFEAGSFVAGFQDKAVTATNTPVAGLAPGVTYYFRVKAVNEGGASAYATASVQTLQAPPEVPANLTASDVTQTSFKFSWDAVTGADSYLIDVATTSTFEAGSFVAGFQDKAVTATNAPVAGLSPGVTYYFRVKAVNEGGASPYATASVQTLQAPPEVPANLTASDVTQTSFLASWDAVTGADNYLIDVATTNTFEAGSFVAGFQDKAVTATNTPVAGLSPGVTYYFRVKAVNEGGTSAYATANLQTPPGMPASLTGSDITQTSFLASWDAVKGADNYLIDVATTNTFDAGTFVTGFKDKQVTSTNIAVTDLSPATTYYFRVKAVNEAGGSPAYSEISVSTAQVPAPLPPGNLQASVVSQTEIRLTWTDHADNEKGYEIFRKGPADTGYQPIIGVGTNVTSFTNTALKSNTTYSYQVRAYNDGGSSAFSNIVSITTTQFPPTLTAVPDQSVNEDAGIQSISLSGITDGGEGEQILTISVTSDNPVLIPVPVLTYTSPNTTGQLQYQPAENLSGSATITVTVADNGPGQHTASKSFEIAVNAVNDAPVFGLSQSIIEVDEDFTPAKSINIIPGLVPDDETAQEVTYSLTPVSVPFAAMSIDPNTGLVSISSLPGRSGTASFTVTANDGQPANNIISRDFTLIINEINDPPIFTVSQNIKLEENFTTTETVTVSPGPVQENEKSQNVTYSLSPATVDFADVSIDPATGTVTITSRPNRSGGQEFTITANDGQSVNNLATGLFNLTVGAVNNAPSFMLGGDIKVSEEFQGIKTVTVTPAVVPDDEKGQIVTYTLSPPSVDFANVTINKNTGLVEITAKPNRYGKATFEVVADDGQTINNLATEEFDLSVLNINDAPTLDDIPSPPTIFENAGEQTISLSGIGPGPFEDQFLAVFASSGNTALIPNPEVIYMDNAETAMLRFTPNPDQAGTAEITVKIIDNGDNTAPHRHRIERKFTVTVSPLNKAPTLSPITSPITIDEDSGDQVVNLNGITAGPGENQVLAISAVSDNPALISDPVVDYVSPEKKGAVHFVPAEDGWGTANITVTVEDDGPGAAPHANWVSQTFQVQVNPVNDPPTLHEIPDPPPVAISAGPQTILLTGISAGPGETQQVSVTVTSDNVAVIPVPAVVYNKGDEHGSLTFKPVAGKSGNAVLTVTVTDSGPGTGSHVNKFSRKAEVRVSNLPDLIFGTDNLEDLYANPGQSLSIISSVKNQGVGSAARNKLTFYLSSNPTHEDNDIEIGTSTVSALQSGDQTEATITLNIPEALAEGSYYILYFVDGEDEVEESNEGNNIAAVRLTVTSNTSPTITSIDVPEFTAANVWPVSAKITLDDNGGIATVRFFHRGITETLWAIDTLSSNLNIYSFELDSLYYDQVGMEYYFEITDKGNIQVNSKTGHSYIQYPEGLSLPPLVTGTQMTDYQIISSPVLLQDNSAGTLFEDDLGRYDPSQWRLFHYEDGNTVEFNKGLSTIEPGKGYWLITKTGKTVDTGPGNTVTVTKSDPFVLALTKGWNQIGNPYNFNISWADVLAYNGNPADVGNLRVYEGGFVNSDRLGSFQGAFVFSEEERELAIPVIRNKIINESGRMATIRPTPEENYWEVNFQLHTPSLTYALGGLGMHSRAETGKDRYDDITLPRFEMMNYLELNFAHPEFFVPKFTRDIIPDLTGYTWEFSVDTDIDAASLTMNWRLVNKDNLEGQLLLFDMSSQQVVDMTKINSYTYGLNGSRLFKVYYGSEAYIQANLKPVRISIGPAFPNPFSEAVTLPFTLPPSPENGHDVRLVVYNQLGQHIKTLSDKVFPPGFHAIKWDGTDHAGNPVSNGMYIYRMTINHKQGFYGRLLLR